MEEAKTTPTHPQLAAWKKKHGKIRLVVTQDENGEELHFWFRKPDMKVLGIYAKFFDTDPLAAVQIVFKNCLLNQDLVTYADDVEVMLSIAEGVNTMVKKRPSSFTDF